MSDRAKADHMYIRSNLLINLKVVCAYCGYAHMYIIGIFVYTSGYCVYAPMYIHVFLCKCTTYISKCVCVCVNVSVVL